MSLPEPETFNPPQPEDKRLMKESDDGEPEGAEEIFNEEPINVSNENNSVEIISSLGKINISSRDATTFQICNYAMQILGKIKESLSLNTGGCFYVQ